MSANSGTSVQGINMSGMIDSVNRSIKNNNSLNFLMRGGQNDVPYAFMGIATIVIAGFTYVTYKDYADEVASGISDTLETIQSSELFIPSKEEEAAPFFSGVQEEPKEESQEESQEESKEESKEEPQEDNKVNVDVIEEKEESKEEKPEEPGEQYKLGGSKQKRKTKRKRKTEKRKRKN